MKNNGRIYGVSLGPGEPELITLKALNALNGADIIFCPGTVGVGGQEKSRALDVLQALPLDKTKIRVFQVPMSENREGALKAYDSVCEETMRLADQGQVVAITAEGDACFYSSANYIYEKLRQADFPVQMIAGVPAFIAAGASVGLHMVKQGERMLVIPGNVSEEELLESVAAGRTLVIMKVPLGEPVLRPFIAQHPELKYHYFEQVGTSREYYTSEPHEILSRPFTYFSILVVMPESEE